MFHRKIEKLIEDHIKQGNTSILCIDGARQIGKTYIIDYVCRKYFNNYIELNMVSDFNGDKLFESVHKVEDFYIAVSSLAGEKMSNKKDTIIFIDEIQMYPHLITLLKDLREEDKYSYICSGSELGIALADTCSIPIGTIRKVEMYPMDFEEFLWANSVGEEAINHMYECFYKREPLSDALHNKILKLFKTYLYVGGLPAAIKAYVDTQNVYNIKQIQNSIRTFYGEDASKYDEENKLKIKRLYDMIPSNIDNKVKRIQFSKIENIDDARYDKYEDEFDYLVASGITLMAQAIINPTFPLVQTSSKKLIKLYMNDVGLLTEILYRNNINIILDDKTGVNLGAVYETVVAQELKCHNHTLFYYDRRKIGEVDFLIDDYDNASIIPIEVKSGKDVFTHSALSKLLSSSEYKIEKAFVLSNNKEFVIKDKKIYIPIYYSMFL